MSTPIIPIVNDLENLRDQLRTFAAERDRCIILLLTRNDTALGGSLLTLVQRHVIHASSVANLSLNKIGDAPMTGYRF